MKIYTMGVAGHSAESFFGSLRDSGAKRLLDIRRWNTSTSAGFTKKRDLPFFVRAICGLEYHHVTALAPPTDLLRRAKTVGVSMEEYTDEFFEALEEREVERKLDKKLIDGAALLCACGYPEGCHRSLVALYLEHAGWGDIEVEDLGVDRLG